MIPVGWSQVDIRRLSLLVLFGLVAIVEGILVAFDLLALAILVAIGVPALLFIMVKPIDMHWKFWMLPMVIGQMLFLAPTRVFAILPIPIAVYLIGWLIPVFVFQRSKWSRNSVVVLALVVIHFLLMALSLSNALVPQEGIRYMTFYALAVAVSMAIPRVYRSLPAIQRVYVTLVVFASVLLVSGLVDILFYDRLRDVLRLIYPADTVEVIETWHLVGRIVGLGVHPGVFSLELCMLSCFSLVFAKRLRSRILTGIFLVLVLYVVVSTGNRMMLLIFIGSFIVQLLVVARSWLAKLKVLSGLTFVGIVLALVSGVFSDPNKLGGLDRIWSLGFDDYSVRTRFILYDYAMHFLRAHPFTGVGIMQFVEYTKLVPGEITYVHNIYLQMATEVGIPGLVVFVGILLATHLPDWKVFRGSNRQAQEYMLPLTSASLMFLVNGLTANPWFGGETLMLFWLMRGLALALHLATAKESHVSISVEGI